MQTQKLKLTNAILPGGSIAFEAGSQRITIQANDLQSVGELKISFGGELSGQNYFFPSGTYGFIFISISSLLLKNHYGNRNGNSRSNRRNN